MAALDNNSNASLPARPVQSRRAPKSEQYKRRAALWNILTILVLLSSLGLVVVFALIFLNPTLPLNPFPPPTLPAVMVMPSSVPTLAVTSPPTETPTPEPSLTPTVTASVTPEPTATATATFALPAVIGTPSPTLRPTATAGGYAFVPQDGSPDAIPYSIYSDVGCGYMGVGGRVLGLDGSPITPGVIVRLAGNLDGQRISLDTLSGTVTQFGESGFGFQLAERPIASSGTLYVQLLDQAYLPMSDRIFFDTYDTCDKNLIFITFRQVR
jgi:hypothetical protein